MIKLNKIKAKQLLFLSLLSGFTLMGAKAQAQQQISHAQHGAFRHYFNPASSLLAPQGEIHLIGKQQWANIEGSPKIFWGSGHVGLDAIRSTLGANIRFESIGPDKQTDANIFFAKSVRLSENQYLGASINVGLTQFQGDYAHIDPNDPAFQDNIRETDFNAGLGLMFYQPEKFYLGVSMPRLSLGSPDNRYDFRNVYYTMAGAYFDLGGDIGLKPAVLASFVENEDVLVEASALVVLKKQFGVGVNVRSEGAMAALAQIQFGSLHLGYSYLFSTGSGAITRRTHGASHEIGLGYRFGGVKGWL
jgi:type IX secretion system PorP/SprF family membrane protein